MDSRSKQVTFDERYVESLILDESKIQYADYAAGRELLLSYSHIPEEQIPSHVADIVSPLLRRRERRGGVVADSEPCPVV